MRPSSGHIFLKHVDELLCTHKPGVDSKSLWGFFFCGLIQICFFSSCPLSFRVVLACCSRSTLSGLFCLKHLRSPNVTGSCLSVSAWEANALIDFLSSWQLSWNATRAALPQSEQSTDWMYNHSSTFLAVPMASEWDNTKKCQLLWVLGLVQSSSAWLLGLFPCRTKMCVVWVITLNLQV